MLSSAVYQLQYQVGSSWEGITNISASPATFTHSGRQPDTHYCYRVEATASTGVRRSDPVCRYTTDGTGRKATRVQIEFHTADVDDAGTDDSVVVVLTEGKYPEPSNTGRNYVHDGSHRAPVGS
jgi:hypothetical protein